MSSTSEGVLDFESHNETNFTLVSSPEMGYDYHFTISIATSVLLGIMTLTTIIGKLSSVFFGIGYSSDM